MKNDLQSIADSLEDLIKIQADSLERGYMHGMLNGMILSHSVITGKAPKYACRPHNKTKIRHKKAKR